jgi:hypothetical protein
MFLFGGAIKLDIPTNVFQDASTIRPIPDNQEVFVSNINEESIIVELIEYNPLMTLEDHFSQLAEDTEVDRCAVVELRENCLYGNLYESKIERDPKIAVHIFMGWKRLPEHGAEILVSRNYPGSCKATLDDFDAFMSGLRVIDTSIFIG